MYIGIDLGGTNIAVGLVDEKGKIVEKSSTPTLSGRDYKEIVADMAKLSNELIEKAGIKKSDILAIGIGSPGSIDNENGIVTYSNNLPMKNTPLAEEMGKYFDVPVNLENDANAAAFGEYIATGADISSFVFVTLGTGVGGGIVLDGKIYRGFNNAGGEIGHIPMILNGEACTCGNKGCWEVYASVTGLIKQTKAAISGNPDSLMKELSNKEGKVSGRTAFEAAKLGNDAAKRVVDQYIEYVSAGLTGIVNIFQPEKLVIGGGISKEGDYLLNPIKKYVSEFGYNKYMKKTEIEIAKLFNDAGIIGAALAAK